MNTLLMKMPLFHRFFATKEESRGAARDRLKSALVGDRQTVAPQLMSCLQKDIEDCMARYLKADKEGSIFRIIDRQGKMTLTVEVPVLHIHRQGTLPEEALQEARQQEESIELKLPGRKLRKGRSRKHGSSESIET